LLTAPLPLPELPAAHALQSAALAADRPREYAAAVAERVYESKTAAHRTEALHLRQLMARETQRLGDRYQTLVDDLREPRTECDYEPGRAMPLHEWLEVAVHGTVLLALLGASVATIKTIALDTGIVQSPAQAIAFGILPALGAFAIARFVSDLDPPSAYRRWKRVVNLAAICALAPWCYLFVTIFGTGATEDLGDVIAQMATGATAPTGGGHSIQERAFFIAAIVFEVCCGATFKIAINQTIRRSRRATPRPSAFDIEREQGLAATLDELSAVVDADAGLAGRLEALGAGRAVYVDSVVAQLTAAPPIQLPTRWRTTLFEGQFADLRSRINLGENGKVER
jgi:hypothetical protein